MTLDLPSRHCVSLSGQALLTLRVAEAFVRRHGALCCTSRREIQCPCYTRRRDAAEQRRDDIGQLAVGLSTDLIVLDLNRLEYAGATHDLAAVQRGQPTTLDLLLLLERHRAESLRMVTARVAWDQHVGRFPCRARYPLLHDPN